MARPHFQRGGARDLDNKKFYLGRHPTKKTDIPQAHEKEMKHIDNCIGGENPR